jgi:hypothetical protein
VAAERKPFATGTWFVEAVTPFVQPQSLEEIAGKARNGIGIEFACNPKMLIKNRFQISCDDSLRNRFGIWLSPTRQRSLKEGSVQVPNA